MPAQQAGLTPCTRLLVNVCAGERVSQRDAQAALGQLDPAWRVVLNHYVALTSQLIGNLGVPGREGLQAWSGERLL